MMPFLIKWNIVMNDSAPNKLQNGFGKFRVLNIAKDKKTIKIFNYQISYLKERNLLEIPGISEADIRASLLKGEIRNKLLVNEILVLENDVDLLQFNNDQKQFLIDIGIGAGLGITIDQITGNISSSRVDGNFDVSRIDGNRDSSCLWDLNGDGDFTDWQQVYDFIQASKRPITVNLSPGQEYTIPNTSSEYYLKNCVFKAQLGDASSCVVNIDDGATLYDLAEGQGAFTLVGYSSDNSRPSLNFTSFNDGVGIYLQQFGNYLMNKGSSPMIVVPDNSLFVIAARFGGGVDQFGSVGNVIRLGSNCTLLATVIGSPIILPEDCVFGDSSTVMIFQQDGSMISPRSLSLPNFNGTYVNAPFGNDAGRGQTIFRPLGVFGALTTGTMFFDTDLIKPIWYDEGSNKWYDASGSGV